MGLTQNCHQLLTLISTTDAHFVVAFFLQTREQLCENVALVPVHKVRHAAVSDEHHHPSVTYTSSDLNPTALASSCAAEPEAVSAVAVPGTGNAPASTRSPNTTDNEFGAPS